jgi:hypothetical protein
VRSLFTSWVLEGKRGRRGSIEGEEALVTDRAQGRLNSGAKTVQVSEACFHTGGNLCKALIDAGKALADRLLQSVEPFVKFMLLHMLEGYHGAGSRGADAVECGIRVTDFGRSDGWRGSLLSGACRFG